MAREGLDMPHILKMQVVRGIAIGYASWLLASF